MNDTAQTIDTPLERDVAETAPPPGVPLLELGLLQCRWPLGDIWSRTAPVTDLFCGEPTREGSSFFLPCRKRAYLPRKAHTAAARPI
ncbi:hypothetical protein [Methylocystis echinoides]|uniref:Uncharacterized protein n=1 Tax=Methylocystis echinoides TaxID=29468 RepID=A0A9W6LSA1_9HYPH|nr:hypothetical protein [Methylocystis echinoides]GLI93368.1 hypothetical protein LMG27198_23600 [Methylocystis echinoides]